MWYAIDPTNHMWVGEQHIKIANGRDFGDCRINQGIFIRIRLLLKCCPMKMNKIF